MNQESQTVIECKVVIQNAVGGGGDAYAKEKLGEKNDRMMFLEEPFKSQKL